MEEPDIEATLHDVHRIAENPSSSPESWDQRASIARLAIARLERTGFMQSRNPSQDRRAIVTSLQRLAYQDADSGGITDVAEWCTSQWLAMLQRDAEDLAALRGLGQAWVARSQSVLARIHRLEGSSSSGSSGRPRNSSDRFSYSSVEDAQEAERATAEADVRAHTADYVEARGMLIAAVDYFTRAIDVAVRYGRLSGELLSEVSMYSTRERASGLTIICRRRKPV
ncbi:hypothetical protein A1O1_07676 [Capronia coronata CBS 617.96]|uniref:Uncharacterized protein n=1 Tax=Capronia coronata CBS 617.96 TaxID=1182541 RepID=W9XX99_9EURO|nr:uncharacterized protein A1O1_07676 [Capronia coronata CBS 617.96]EXJ81611.1 hypothetical protein A1O1_07676 [Capronia coronata CBS 617.96]